MSSSTPAAHTTNPSGINIKLKQSDPVTTNDAGETSRVTTDGSVVQSADPTTDPDASMGQKLKGDLQGAISGTVGGIQAATGATLRNTEMEQKGLDKMQEEDLRLGAKKGVMPVGSEQREGKIMEREGEV